MSDVNDIREKMWMDMICPTCYQAVIKWTFDAQNNLTGFSCWEHHWWVLEGYLK